MGPEQQTDDVSAAFNSALRRVSLIRHIGRAVTGHSGSFGLTALTTFGVFWGAITATTASLAVSFSGWPPYLGVLGLSLLAGALAVVYRYLRTVPCGFEKESREAQRLAHLQPARWQFKLARRLLHDRLAVIDGQLSKALAGLTFVPIARSPELKSYVDWLKLRPPNLLRMVAVAKQLVVFDLPGTLLPSGSSPSPQDILHAVRRIEALYSQAYEFQVEGLAIEPPDECRRVHDIHQQWVDVIRDAIHQLSALLDQLVDVDSKRGEATVEFEVLFHEPVGADEFNDELDRLSLLFGR